MNRIKINRINYYILLSVMIHSFLFLFIEKERDVTLGEKIIPIELVDDLSEAGFGEATKRSKRLIKKPSIKEELKNEIEKKNPLDEQESFKDNKINEKKIQLKKDKSNLINQPMSKEEKGSGFIKGVKNNEPEKGSLKGKGTLKVTCLKCISPIYPPIALRRGAEGTPIVKIWINRNGTVEQAKLITKSGNEQIDKASLKAAKNSVFYPIQQESSINIEYQLRIK